MPTTQENLKQAFAGESQANRKYIAFARRAEKEGFRNIASLFRTAAEAETIHALGHFAALDGVGSTAQNLQAAIDGETYEFTQMYPPMVEQAEREKHRGKRMMEYATKAEAVHARLYKMALEAAQAGKDLDQVEFYLCPTCGNIEIGRPTAPCAICATKPEKFIRV
jgi:rubrerythrin